MPQSLPIGKIRLLQHCSTHRGALAVLALDHRGNLRQLLNPKEPESVSESDLVSFKQMVVKTLAPASSAMLLDPQFSAAQNIASGDLPGRTGLVVALEATGYAGESTSRTSRIQPGWSVEKARRMGANAIKLLVYYHPDAEQAAEMEALVEFGGEGLCHARNALLPGSAILFDRPGDEKAASGRTPLCGHRDRASVDAPGRRGVQG